MAEKKSFKKDKFAEQIQNEVNTMLRLKLNNPHLTFCSITKVELSDDKTVAKLYWDTFDAHKRGSMKSALEATLGRIRSELAKILKTRTVPHLELHYDGQFDATSHIEKLLNEDKNRQE